MMPPGENRNNMRKPLAIVLFALLTAAAVGAASTRRIDPPIITPDGGHYTLNAKVRVSIRGEAGTRLVYTLDGSMPEPHLGIRCESNVVFFDLPAGDVVVTAIAVRAGVGQSNAQRTVFTRSAAR